MICGGCQSAENQIKKGWYKRRSDNRRIQRYRCKTCGRGYSSATSQPEYRQKKRQVNSLLERLLSSTISQRRAALILNISAHTVAKKMRFLAEQSHQKFQDFWAQHQGVAEWQFDELQTIEHTKLKPLSIAVAVDTKTRKIMGFSVSRMPATGHLAAISRVKYGWRKDERRKGLQSLLEQVKSVSTSTALIRSDQCQFYEPAIRRAFRNARYEQFKGEKAISYGHGELKKGRDPLFSINHTLAMLRANINRLVRRSWCTTKDPARLWDHLMIYAHFHNTTLTPA